MIRTLSLCAALAALPATASAQVEIGGPGSDPIFTEDVLTSVERTRDLELGSRVVNGVPVSQEQYPYMTLLEFSTSNGYRAFCGGAQIAPQWVLTAAHCFVRKDKNGRTAVAPAPRQARVRRGMTDRASAGEALDIAEIVPHPGYNPDKTYNDIALLRLRTPVDRPLIGLPAAGADPKPRTPVHIVGWGRQKHGKDEKLADRLQMAKTDLVSRQECDSVLKQVVTYIRKKKPGFAGPGPIDRTRICARVKSKGRPVDSCQGDSGGPLILRNRYGDDIAVGVVSFGFGCAIPGVHGVYTNTSHYRKWIEDVTGLTEFGGSRPQPAPPRPPSGGQGSTGGGAQAEADRPAPPSRPTGSQGDLTSTESEVEISLRIRGGSRVSPGQPLIFEVSSPIGGRLLLFDVGPDGDVVQIFPNHRTERRRIKPLITPGGTFVTPVDRHAFRFRAPDQPTERIIFAMVTPPGDPGPAATTRGLGPAPDAVSYLDQASSLLAKYCGGGGRDCAVAAVRLVVD